MSVPAGQKKGFDSLDLAYADWLAERMARLPERPVVGLRGSREEVERAMRERREAIARDILAFPEERPPPGGEVLRTETTDTHVLQSVLLRAEADSRITALYYHPANAPEPRPGIVLASGHGGSKSSEQNQIAAQMYVRLGCSVIVPDPIGEEERNDPPGMGLRGHRKAFSIDRSYERGRPFIGKVVYDLSRCVDFLVGRPEIDNERIGCAGSSLGGTTTQLLVAADPRLRLCLNSSWSADYKQLDPVRNAHSRGCCYRAPALLRHANQEDLLALSAPHCATLVLSGAEDEICPTPGLEAMGERLAAWWASLGAPDRFECGVDPEGGHRHYHITPKALAWIAKHFRLDDAAIGKAPQTTLGRIFDEAGLAFNKLYDVERHHRGTPTLDIPLHIRSPEQLRLLNDDSLAARRLERDHFTLQGWMRSAPRFDKVDVPARPSDPGDVTRRLEDYLGEAPGWYGRPLPTTPQPTEGAAGHRAWITGDESLPLALRIGAPSVRPERVVLQLLPERRHDASIPEAGGAGAETEALAVPDLLRLNDNELLAGTFSGVLNLWHLRRCLVLLRREFPDTQLHLRSRVPRLGELLYLIEPALAGFELDCASSAETSTAIAHRAENVFPGINTRMAWLDPFLAAAPRPVTLRKSYFTEAAAEMLGKCWRSREASAALRWL